MGLGVILFGLFAKNLPRLQLYTSAILTDQSKERLRLHWSQLILET